jgi:predicted DNA-binding helix-hairpin-helix protein
VLSAKRIIAARRTKNLTLEDTKKLGIVMKRAIFFITCSGKYGAPLSLDAVRLRSFMADRQGKRLASPFQIRLEDLDVLRV